MESKEAVKLVGFWASPYSHRVEWALRLKGVEYEYIGEDIFNKSLLLELNPVHKRVPVLIHGDKAILESLIILEYIDKTWKQHPILPQDPYDRALARFWAKFADEELLVGNVWRAVCTQGERKETHVKQAVEAVERIEQELIKGKSKFFGGESVGYLDIALGWISYWLPILEEVGSMTIVDPIHFPATTGWMESFYNHHVVKDKLPPRDMMVAYFQWRSKEIGARMATARKG